jgi:transposase-like protein
MTNDSPVACPLCESPQTVRTNVIATRAFHFCLACGKSFERRIEKPKQIPPPEQQGT